MCYTRNRSGGPIDNAQGRPYGDRVPNAPRTPSRSLRVLDPEWEGLDVVTKSLGMDRGKWLKQAIEWMFYAPDSDPLPRPPLGELAVLIAAEAEQAPSRTAEERRRKAALTEMAEKLRERARLTR